ncbi:MMPL family transporter [Epidermidibacterium keratini]|uniref:MMPL family transporter n=1 Tax=Epidermidibacterium keratini TaxID=1891644 RepID=A0A7L4YQT7_9ACTN|nr:MMPL family transporter [Epidermidibacterium keratini]QHC01428.1 MMPL family transporter [Epidermidibacterium keratini]
MATLLYRLGHAAARRAKTVLAIWLIALAAVGGLAVAFSGTFTSELTIPGLKSQAALNELQDKLPAAGGTTGRIVFEAPEGSTLTDPAYQVLIGEAVTETEGLDKVGNVLPPLPGQSISEDGRLGYLTITFEGQITAIPVETLESIQQIADNAEVDGLNTEIGGAAVAQTPALGSTEAIGVIVAMVVLLVTFGSVVAAGLPMLTALIGLGIGVGGVLIVSGFIEMSNTAPILAVMLGLAVGIDYALFVVSKHRQQVRRGMEIEESIARATATSGTAVVFAGLTVVIALAGLSVVGIPFLTVMGLASAFTVAIAVLVAITLVPALLSLAGRKILPKKQREVAPTAAEIDAEEHHQPNRWIRFVSKRPVVASLLSIILLGVIAIPAMQLRLGLPTDETAPLDTTKRQAYDLVVDGFGEGANNPLIVTVKPDQPLQLDPQSTAAIEAGVQQQLAAQAQMPGAPALDPQTAQELGTMAVEQAKASQLLAPYVDRLAALDNVAAATPVSGTPDGEYFVIQVVPGTGASEEATSDLVHTLRDEIADLGDEYGATLDVTGLNVVGIDIADKLAAALPIYLAVVVGLALVLLLLVFRSIVVPLKAVVGFLLTIGASFGAVVAVYQLGWGGSLFGVDTPAPIVAFLPVLLIGILFGLSMDYEMFLVSGMREAHAHGTPAKRAVVDGYMVGSRVVTAAAIIMTSVFAGFILAPDPIIASIGFALAIGVLADAFVVRMTLVPAVMTLLGERAWYLPKWLDRMLPNVDVEGTALMERLERNERNERDERRETASVG